MSSITYQNSSKIPRMRNHSTFQKLYSRWKKQTQLHELDYLKSKQFSSDQYIKPLLLASTSNLSISTACQYYRSDNQAVPSSETVLKSIRTQKMEKVEIEINQTLREQFLQFPRKIRQSFSKHGVVIIDFHEDPYYGDKDTPYLTKGAVKRSTKTKFSYLTADIWSPNGELTIACLVRRSNSTIFDQFFDLYSLVTQVLHPKLILMDGEFSTVRIMKELQRLSINFIARIAIRRRIKPLAIAYELTDKWEKLRQFKAITLLDHSKKHSTTVQITFQLVHTEMKALVTSLGIKYTLKQCIKWYKCRFGIETGYRDKHLFQARTCSKSIEIRLILYLLAIMLWNLWQAFLMLIKHKERPPKMKNTRWRRELRTISLLLLRDELL